MFSVLLLSSHCPRFLLAWFPLLLLWLLPALGSLWYTRSVDYFKKENAEISVEALVMETKWPVWPSLLRQSEFPSWQCVRRPGVFHSHMWHCRAQLCTWLKLMEWPSRNSGLWEVNWQNLSCKFSKNWKMSVFKMALHQLMFNGYIYRSEPQLSSWTAIKLAVLLCLGKKLLLFLWK